MSTKRHIYAVSLGYGDYGPTRGGITGELLNTIFAFDSLAEFLETRDAGHLDRSCHLVRVSRRSVVKEFGRHFYIDEDKTVGPGPML